MSAAITGADVNAIRVAILGTEIRDFMAPSRVVCAAANQAIQRYCREVNAIYTTAAPATWGVNHRPWAHFRRALELFFCCWNFYRGCAWRIGVEQRHFSPTRRSTATSYMSCCRMNLYSS